MNDFLLFFWTIQFLYLPLHSLTDTSKQNGDFI